MTDTRQEPAQRDDDTTVGGPAAGYAPESERPPLAQYAVLASGFGAGLTAFVLARRASGGLPERARPGDIALAGIAAHRISRLVTSEKVTAFMRAPFTELQGKGELPAELSERPRGSGLQRMIGELLTCPYCLDMWAAAGMTAAITAAPAEGRFVASLLSAATLSDFLQIGYRAAANRR